VFKGFETLFAGKLKKYLGRKSIWKSRIEQDQYTVNLFPVPH
jgi:hypothetical protein